VPTPTTRTTSATRDALLAVAAAAIRDGVRLGYRPVLRPDAGSLDLRTPGASFVTLHLEDRLRGCIGSLVAKRSILEDVHHNAYSAAFEDPRFPRVVAAELMHLQLEVALLSTPEPVVVASRDALLAMLEAERPGVVIDEGGRRATFLPKVWEMIPSSDAFLSALLRKAGLPEDHWSDTLRVETYGSETFDCPLSEALHR